MLGTVLAIVFAVLIAVTIVMTVLVLAMAAIDDYDERGERMFLALNIAAVIGVVTGLVGLAAAFILA